ncbi:phospholipid methyltransferase-domain-containing protein [Lipomyces japonicus]|uniref:phospholipid methyltransferase-domain-containing protein n=1 Tax=Lipomyces japonicus TaxID=56871 RepID=UPI0034CE5CF5
MVTALLDPRERKSLADVITLTVLAAYLALFAALPSSSVRTYAFLALYAASRLAYNGGLGLLLLLQSRHCLLTKAAAKSGLFARPSSSSSSSSSSFKRWTYRLLRHELSAKMGADYNFDAVPVEFNTWLLFRRLVDFILMSDFVTYMLFALSVAKVPAGQSLVLHLARWAAGMLLFVFNLWVKLDAHRVVKDYAWYWGDFFFLQDLQLCFDGIFELFPHPMYSVGYAGYYGISLMAVSAAAHALQFAFLFFVENPHIAKTYGVQHNE